MSEYADIKIRNLSLYSFRNYLQDDIVYFLFSKKIMFVFRIIMMIPKMKIQKFTRNICIKQQFKGQKND